MKRTVTHLIAGLGKGGAETMLYQILRYNCTPEIENHVISMGGSSFFECQIKELGVKLYVVGFKKHPISSFLKIVKLLRETKTDTLCCWMYHANFVGYYAAKLAGIRKIVWNVRHSNLSKEYNKAVTLKIIRLCAKLSKRVDAVIYNGEKAKSVHENIGYCKEKSAVLENGVDTETFRPNIAAKSDIVRELKIDEDKKIILSAARYHPIKDFPTFLKAFEIVHKKFPYTTAVLCGNGVDESNEELVALCDSLDLSQKKDIFLLGPRDDVHKLMAASDVFVLHSVAEAFPNVLIQAMSCGCNCVSTDVGDVAKILENKDLVVDAGDFSNLSGAIIKQLEKTKEEHAAESSRIRKIVEEKYDINDIVKKYEFFY